MVAATLAGCGGRSAAAPSSLGGRTYAQARVAVGGLAAAKSPIPVYLPTSIPGGTPAGRPWVAARYAATRTGYQVGFGYGRGPLAFGNAELLMTVIGAGPGGSIDLSQWIPIPRDAPVPNAAQGQIDLGDGLVGTTFGGILGGQQMQAVTWREGGWTFWVAPSPGRWNPAGAAEQQAKDLHGLALPGSDGVAVFSFGQDDPSEAAFSLGGDRYAVEAFGWLAPQLAASMQRVGPGR